MSGTECFLCIKPYAPALQRTSWKGEMGLCCSTDHSPESPPGTMGKTLPRPLHSMATALLSLSRCAKKADKGLSGMWELMQRPLTHTHAPAVDRIATTHAARPP